MTYRDALFFIGKCLVLRQYPERIEEIRNLIRSGAVEWEQVVWVSTGQFVFPALYIQLKHADLLEEMPHDLVEYMDEFTTKNRERNQQIVNEAIEISALLNKYEISPIFLKGTAHLLDNLYEDIAERMVGDIDLLVEETEMVPAAEILITAGYTPLNTYNPKDFKVTKHYPRLINGGLTAAVEIHRQILMIPYNKTIDSKELIRACRRLDLPVKAYVLGDAHQIIHNILNVQINDHGYYYADIFLRQEYDLLLLAKRINSLQVVRDFGHYLPRMNGNLAVTAKILNNPDCISFEPNWQVNLFLKRIMRNINHLRWKRFSHAVLYLTLRFSNYARVLIHITYDKDARDSLFTRLSNPKWYGAHFKSYKNLF